MDQLLENPITTSIAPPETQPLPPSSEPDQYHPQKKVKILTRFDFFGETHFVDLESLRRKTILITTLGVAIASAISTNMQIILSQPPRVNLAETNSAPKIIEPQRNNIPKAESPILNTKSDLSILLFDHKNIDELKRIKQAIEDEKKIFLKDDFGETTRFQMTNLWNGLIKEVVADPRLGIPEDHREVWEALTKMVIYVESGGNPVAKSQKGAQGLMQIKPSVASERAKEIGMEDFNLINTYDNMLLGLRELQWQLKLNGGELKTAFFGYNMGQGTVIKALQRYLISDLKLPIDEVKRNFEKMGADGRSERATSYYMREYDIDLDRLISSDAVRAELLSQGFDRRDFIYLTRLYLAFLKLFPDQAKEVFGNQS